MDVVKAVRDYISKTIQDVSGMKVLLLDEETVNWLSSSNQAVVDCFF
jgi:hypothetical protein